MKRAKKTDLSQIRETVHQYSCALQGIFGPQAAWILVAGFLALGVGGAAAANPTPKQPAPSTPKLLTLGPTPTPAATATAFCQQLSARLPNLPQRLCAQAELVSSGARSVRGQTLWQRDVLGQEALRDTSRESARELTRPEAPGTLTSTPRLRVLVIGGIHGDELSSTSLAFHWMPRAAETPADIQWRFVPAMNPDGLLAAKPMRVNANGVDLNRNFATPHWAKEAPRYWEVRTRKDPRRYPGPKALSEPESRFISDEMARFKPNLIVAIHAPYGVLDFDGPSVPPSRLGRLYLDQVGIFPGSLGNYGGVHKAVPVVTIELPSAIRTPTDAEMRQMWLDLVRWMDERLLTSARNAPGR